MAPPRNLKPRCTVCRCPLTVLTSESRIMCFRCQQQRQVIPITEARRQQTNRQPATEEAEAWFQRAMSDALKKVKRPAE